MVGGKRLVRQFQTPVEAEAFAADLRTQRAAAAEAERFERRNRAVSLANLSDEQRADVLSAFRAMEGTRGTLTAAAKFWLQHSAPATARTCNEVLAELLQSCTAANRRVRTITELRRKVGAFCADYGPQPVASITAHDIATWLDGRAGRLSPKSRASFRQALNRLFGFAARRGYREGNPVAAIERPTIEAAVPEVFTPAEVRRLLDAAQAAVPDMIPYFAIGLFAGLRTENELRNLDWRMIDFAERAIEVTAASAKKRRHRSVEMSDNLLAWLMPHRRDAGRIYFSKAAYKKVLSAAGVRWPRNVMRHSFASYHLAAHNEAGRTALALGHPNGVEILFAHYRRLVRPAVAHEYWSISPGNAGRIIPLQPAEDAALPAHTPLVSAG